MMEITDSELAYLDLLLQPRILACKVIAADLLQPAEDGVSPEESKIGFDQKSSYRLIRPSDTSPPCQRRLPYAFRDRTAVGCRYSGAANPFIRFKLVQITQHAVAKPQGPMRRRLE